MWTAHVTNRGYGTLGETVAPGKSTSRYAHRVSYEMHHGPIPEGLVVDHLCNTKRCVNPDHLQVLTSQENIARSTHPVIERRKQGRCIRGHDLTDPANLYRRPDNNRVACRACFRARQQEAARRRGVPARRPPSPCGTYSAYTAHYRRGEAPCEPCREARRRYDENKRKKAA